MTAVTAPEVMGRLVHVDTMESLAARVAPGDELPVWAEEPSPTGSATTHPP